MPAAYGKGILLTIRRLVRERRAVSAVEFALLVPVMLVLFLGGTEITQGITIKRKVTIATRTIADLVAQDTSITDNEMTAIFSATDSVLAPYSGANLKIVISSVAIDANGVATIVWSEAHNGGTARSAKSSVTLPDGLNSFPNTKLIWAETEYKYTPTIGYVVTGSIDLKDKLYLRPRLAPCVERVSGAQKFC